MTLEERLDKIERAFGAQDDLGRELRDAVTVTAEMEARQARALKEHAQWLVRHDRDMEEHSQRMRELDERIASLVSA